MKKIVFLTGTRADYGKIKTLMKKVEASPKFELYIFVTGMHMLSMYGSTWRELEKDGFINTYHYINQNINTHMDITLSNTILGLSNYINEIKPDMIVVHGDRLEALAGAIVGALNNIKVAHIEGGEISGTIDESIRHAITKFSHIHFVSNDEAKNRIIQLGEPEENIFVIGSPDIDIMLSEDLPSIEEVKKYYGINYNEYGILMYHPVTTEVPKIKTNVTNLVEALLESKKNFVVIYPNNDEGSRIILEEYQRFTGNDKIKVFPSMRFEYFLSLLKHSNFMIGNSSAGVRETGVYGIPAIDLGSRQRGRYNLKEFQNIIPVIEEKSLILNAINNVNNYRVPQHAFGNGESDHRFMRILEAESIWNLEIQKKFIDVEY